MEKYKQAVESAANELMKEYQRYQLTPESHPKYDEEWKKFWYRRYKELKKEGKVNPEDYDYTDEWSRFWKIRAKEILHENNEAEEKKIRLRFKLPTSYEPLETKESKKRARSADVFEVISSDEDTREKRRIAYDYEEISSDDLLPDYSYYSRRRPYPEKHSRFESPRSHGQRVKYSSEKPQASTSFDDCCEYNDNVSMISVCRLLSALETELGCLSLKVLDLLSKAIALDKVNPTLCDETLMTTDNVLFLETVKEKLKGLLMIGLSSESKTFAIKKCIQNIAKLIHQTPVKEEAPMKDPPGEMNETTKLAMEISEVLKAHGMENCTSEELEVLVEIYLENDQKLQNEATEEVPVPSNSDSIGSLSDEDLKILLSNFIDLRADEQNKVIEFMTKMEKTDHARVESLRKYVKLADDASSSNIVEIDNDSDDYNINEAVRNVVTKLESPVVSYQQNRSINSEESLTDNLLTFPLNNF